MIKFKKYLVYFYTGTKAVFSPSMWSGQEGRTTNNGAESFHRHFGDLFGYLRSKPSIWHFLRNLKRYNTFKDVKIRSTKAIPLASSETDRLVNLYEAKSLTVRALLYKLSQKNQPKIKKKVYRRKR